MTNTDRERFVGILCAMAEMFDKELSEGVLSLYWSCMKHLDFDAFHAASSRAMRACKFMPRPVELLELAEGGTAEDRAIREWDGVREAVDRHGAYASVTFADPVTCKTVIALGGWSSGICRPDEGEQWLRKRFLETWAAYDASRDSLHVPTHLAGLIEAENGGRYAAPPPALIGTTPPRPALPEPDARTEDAVLCLVAGEARDG